MRKNDRNPYPADVRDERESRIEAAKGAESTNRVESTEDRNRCSDDADCSSPVARLRFAGQQNEEQNHNQRTVEVRCGLFILGSCNHRINRLISGGWLATVHVAKFNIPRVRAIAPSELKTSSILRIYALILGIQPHRLNFITLSIKRHQDQYSLKKQLSGLSLSIFDATQQN